MIRALIIALWISGLVACGHYGPPVRTVAKRQTPPAGVQPLPAPATIPAEAEPVAVEPQASEPEQTEPAAAEGESQPVGDSQLGGKETPPDETGGSATEAGTPAGEEAGAPTEATTPPEALEPPVEEEVLPPSGGWGSTTEVAPRRGEPTP